MKSLYYLLFFLLSNFTAMSTRIQGQDLFKFNEELKDLSIFQKGWPPFHEFANDLEAECRKNGKSLNVTEIELELTNCTRPKVQEFIAPFQFEGKEIQVEHIVPGDKILIGLLRNPDFFKVLRRVTVERICRFIPSLVKCLKLQLDKVEFCSESHSEVEKKMADYADVVLKSFCSDDGDKLIQFLEEDEMTCAPSYLMQGAECFMNRYEVFIDRDGDIIELPNPKFCSELGGVHNCIDKSLDNCTSPTPILRSMLDDVKDWVSSPECVQSKASLHNESIAVLLAIFVYRLCN